MEQLQNPSKKLIKTQK